MVVALPVASMVAALATFVMTNSSAPTTFILLTSFLVAIPGVVCMSRIARQSPQAARWLGGTTAITCVTLAVATVITSPPDGDDLGAVLDRAKLPASEFILNVSGQYDEEFGHSAGAHRQYGYLGNAPETIEATLIDRFARAGIDLRVERRDYADVRSRLSATEGDVFIVVYVMDDSDGTVYVDMDAT